MGQIPALPVARHQLAEGGGVGEGEEVHSFRVVGGRGDGPEEQLGADGDAHPRLGHGQGGDGVLRLQNQLGLEVVAAEILIYNVPGAVAPLNEDEGQVLKGLDVRPFGILPANLPRLRAKELVGEGAGYHHHQPLLSEGDGGHPLHDDGLEADNQVGPAVGQLVLQLGGVALKEGKLHLGKLRPEPGQNIGQQGQPAGVGDAHPQHPQILLVDVPHLGQILAVQVQNLGGGVHQQPPRVGEGQLWGAGEQLHVQLPLQIADVVGQGLLGDVQPLRRPGDVQLFRHHEEVL